MRISNCRRNFTKYDHKVDVGVVRRKSSKIVARSDSGNIQQVIHVHISVLDICGAGGGNMWSNRMLLVQNMTHIQLLRLQINGTFHEWIQHTVRNTTQHNTTKTINLMFIHSLEFPSYPIRFLKHTRDIPTHLTYTQRRRRCLPTRLSIVYSCSWSNVTSCC